MLFRQIFDDRLSQYAYLIGCQRTGEALIVDAERDVDRYQRLAQAEGLRIVAAAETHIHADFLSGTRELAEAIPGLRLYLSNEGDADWKYAWASSDAYGTHLVKDRDTFSVGSILFEVRHTAGHTPEHISFLVTDSGGRGERPDGSALR